MHSAPSLTSLRSIGYLRNRLSRPLNYAAVKVRDIAANYIFVCMSFRHFYIEPRFSDGCQAASLKIGAPTNTDPGPMVAICVVVVIICCSSVVLA